MDPVSNKNPLLLTYIHVQPTTDLCRHSQRTIDSRLNVWYLLIHSIVHKCSQYVKHASSTHVYSPDHSIALPRPLHTTVRLQVRLSSTLDEELALSLASRVRFPACSSAMQLTSTLPTPSIDESSAVKIHCVLNTLLHYSNPPINYEGTCKLIMIQETQSPRKLYPTVHFLGKYRLIIC